MDALTAGPSMTRRPSGGGWSFDAPGPDVPAQPEPGAGLLSPGAGPATARPAQVRVCRPATAGPTGPGVPRPAIPTRSALPGRPHTRPSAVPPRGPTAGRPATGEPAAPGPGRRARCPPWPASCGRSRWGPLRPPPTPGARRHSACAGRNPRRHRRDAARTTDPRRAGAGITPVVIPAEPAARAARRPVLFSVAGGDTPPRPTARQVTSAAQDATGPADPRAADPADPAQHRPSARSPTRRHLPPGRRRHPPRRGRRPRPRPSRPPRRPGPRTPDDRRAGGGRTRPGAPGPVGAAL